MDNKIVYFVDDIQTSFVINDIKRVASKVDIIYLFSVDSLEGKDALPKNVIVFEEYVDWNNYQPLHLVLKNLFPILSIYIRECFAIKKILPFKKSIALLASNIFKAECIRGMLIGKGERHKDKSEDNIPMSIETPSSLSRKFAGPNYSSLIGYSFWFYDCIYLAWLRKKGWINKAITRTHGGDLFEERGSLSGKILFRHFQGWYLDKILSVSKTGSSYLQNKYPKFKHKIETEYLGSTSHENLNPINKGERFVLVSCAMVRNIKRIHKIAEMLQYIDFPLTWYHIGYENLQAKNDKTIAIYIDNIEKLKSKKNVEFVAKGNMNNKEIFHFFRDIPINLFISLSEAEGIPVSMMEAISFGIPVISTDVGGCKEIVTDETGILISLETEMKEVAQFIKEFKNSPKNTLEFRNGVRKFWEEYFDAEKNYSEFMKYLN